MLEDWEEAVYYQQKDWEAEQEFYASEDAKAQANLQAQEDKMTEDKEGLLLTDEEIKIAYGQGISDKIPEWDIWAYGYEKAAKLVAQAQLSKVLLAGYKSPEEVGAMIEELNIKLYQYDLLVDQLREEIKEAKKQERERIFKEIEKRFFTHTSDGNLIIKTIFSKQDICWWQALKSPGKGES